MINNKVKIEKYIFFLILSILGAVMLFLNYYTPVLLDDCEYASGIQSIKDIFWTQVEHYQTTNGRFFSHSIVQFFLGIVGKDIFAFFNSIVVVGIVLMAYLCTQKREYNVFALLLVITYVWFAFPDQYVTFLMVAGSVNYIWATLILLVYLYHFEKYQKREISSVLQLVFNLLVSFFVGGFTEMYSVCVFPALIISLFINKVKINKFIVTSLGGFLLGTLFVVLAPGNFVRLEAISGDIDIITKIKKFVLLLIRTKYMYLYCVLLASILWLYYKKRFEFLTQNIFYLVAIIISTAFVFVSGAWWYRPFYPVFVFSLIFLLKTLRHILEVNAFKGKVLVSIVLFLLFLISGIYECKSAIYNRSIVNDILLQAQVEKKYIVTNYQKFRKTKMSYTHILGEYQDVNNKWRNDCFAKYYGLDSICYLPYEKYLLLKNNKRTTK